MQQQEHVSEETAKMNEIMGKEGPDIEGQGTPVQDILKAEPEAQKQAPQVMKDSIRTGQGAANAKPSTSRSFSTLTRRRQQDLTTSTHLPSSLDPSMIPTAAQRATYTDSHPPAPPSVQDTKTGHKFPLPSLPLPPTARKDERYDPIVTQLTNLLMRDGKKATAQRNMTTILTHLRTSPAPVYNPTRPLLPGAPPASHLPLHPILYLTLAIDSVAPLLRIRSQRGAAGGGVALQIPVPLGLRQRRRQAFMWILDAAEKRQNRGSGRDMFATRVAEELVGIVEGRSGVWERRAAVHRLGTTSRSNLTYGSRGRR
ncbi:hypothetical protein BAUCODRAFT_67254 [Baudoinia panamericana UAMH 10762]|uniref:Small ribosomal subunit protein uS7m n=1 Tax=Baudoinia panamericana (strain UAMH 10762) TaxID=717646 RepID=M2NFM4_BAUPA|nr:uncharacterized protein BAUCODRAFT_67254 [Baudoinia panamericana UAMH 10762]EMC98044.1 hypothetical protein BAUCODRAFT_67254 [Baudoinia panamericana UAMH 10762]